MTRRVSVVMDESFAYEARRVIGNMREGLLLHQRDSLSLDESAVLRHLVDVSEQLHRLFTIALRDPVSEPRKEDLN